MTVTVQNPSAVITPDGAERTLSASGLAPDNGPRQSTMKGTCTRN